MKMDEKQAFLNDFRKLLVKYSKCEMQRGWPCGTCTVAVLDQIINKKDRLYREHNKPIDRLNEFWRAILQMREGDKYYRAKTQKIQKTLKKIEDKK